MIWPGAFSSQFPRRCAARIGLCLFLAVTACHSAQHVTPAAAASVSRVPKDIDAFLREALGEQSFTVYGMRTGFNSRGAWRVETSHGRLFCKQMPDATALPEPRWQTNLHNVRTASDLGVGPHVVAYDSDSRLLLLEFVDGELARYDTVGLLRFAQPTLAALRALHTRASTDVCRTDDVGFAKQDADALLVEARKNAVGEQQAWALHAWRVLHHIADALQEHRYVESWCHGDVHPGNVIRVHDSVVLIDWDESGFCDPWNDVSTYAFEAGLPIEELGTWVDMYQGHRDGLQRLELVFARSHARRLLTAIVGMPWDTAGHRDAQVESLKRIVRHDAEFLHHLDLI